MTTLPARVLILSSAKHLSGGVRQALYQAQAMAAAGVDVRLLSDAGSEVERIAEGFPIHPLHGPVEKWRPQVEEYLHPDGPTVVHAFHNKAVKRLAYWGVRWRLTRRPVVCVAHRGVCHPPGNPLPYLLPGIDCFAPNSRACGQVLRRKGLPGRRLRVVDNAVPPERVTPARDAAAVRAELGLPGDAFVIGSVLGDNPLKGMETLLRAFGAARAKGLDAHLLAVGVTPERWTAQTAATADPARVHLPGKRDHVADYLQCMDAFAFPSHGAQDSQPNALLEAVLMGLPAMATTVGGVPEVLEPGGLLVPPGDVDALAGALLRMGTDEALRTQLADINRRAAPRFTPQARTAALLELYGELLHRRGLAGKAL